MKEVTALAQQLIQQPSITPDDKGCQNLLAQRLAAYNFTDQSVVIGEVSNRWLLRGDQGPTVLFAGHTDVVPVGDSSRWQWPPFAGHIADGTLHGRGAVDMKGGLAAMVVACERFVDDFPQHPGQIGFLLTSDEEGPARHGTRQMVPWLAEQGYTIDYCIIGEPSSSEKLADTIRVGRRGSINVQLTIEGVAGHVAYPHLVQNPAHVLGKVITELAETVWDQGNEHFPPTSFQISNIHAGVGVHNVAPGTVDMVFNLRFAPMHTQQSLQQRLQDIVERVLANEAIANGDEFTAQWDWQSFAPPYYSPPDRLAKVACDVVQEVTGYCPELNTAGGTSDGRFLIDTQAQIIELGPLNATAHKRDESVIIHHLEQLTDIYYGLLKTLLIGESP